MHLWPVEHILTALCEEKSAQLVRGSNNFLKNPLYGMKQSPRNVFEHGEDIFCWNGPLALSKLFKYDLRYGTQILYT